ncbi:MAG: DDE-type integrase/transposase/recombinase [Clostridia bacterium]
MPRRRPKDRQQAAASHYAAIAPRIEQDVPPGQRMALWRALAAEQAVTVRTLQRWYERFVTGGLDGLMPAEHRSDRGTLRALPQAVIDAAVTLRREQPERSGRTLVLLLESMFPEYRGRIVRPTLDRHLRRLGATRRQLGPGQRVLRRFHSPHRNALWIADFVLPPLLWQDGEAHKPAVILGIIDHHTRRLVHFAAHPNRQATAVEDGLKSAIATFGLPATLYTDNGSELVGSLVDGACAKLGIRHIRSGVGLPEGRGAAERFFRTFQDSFLPEMAAKAMVPTLAELNRFLGAWQHEFYEQEPHDGLGGKLSPLAAWEADPTPLRPVDPARLNTAFLLSLERRVDKTALVSLHGVRYLCPDALVGAKVEIRYHPARPDQPPQIWENGRFVQLAFPYVPPEQVPHRPASPPPSAVGPTLSALDVLDAQRQKHLQANLAVALPAPAGPLPFTEAAAAALLERALGRRLDPQEGRWLADTWRRCGGLDATICDQALGAFIARHGTGQHLVHYLDQIQQAHVRARRGGGSAHGEAN